jgi:integrase
VYTSTPIKPSTLEVAGGGEHPKLEHGSSGMCQTDDWTSPFILPYETTPPARHVIPSTMTSWRSRAGWTSSSVKTTSPSRSRGSVAKRSSPNAVTPNDGPFAGLSVESVSRRFGQLAERVGLADVRLHDIRHAFATRLLEHGVHPKVVSEALGHASIGITLDTYSHVMPTMSQVAADALEEVFGK